jgi:hypothetical protein
MLDLAAQNLTSPVILCFVLGLAAALARSDLAFPEAIAKGMSLYLLFAIGFKGGAAVSDHGVDLSLGLAVGQGWCCPSRSPWWPMPCSGRWRAGSGRSTRRRWRGITARSRS